MCPQDKKHLPKLKGTLPTHAVEAHQTKSRSPLPHPFQKKTSTNRMRSGALWGAAPGVVPVILHNDEELPLNFDAKVVPILAG